MRDGIFRVRLVRDEDAEPPYNDGSTPILRLDRNGTYVQQFNTQATEQLQNALSALQGYGDDVSRFERYVRSWHGTKSFATVASDDYLYVAFDTAEWRESVGLTDAHCAATTDEDWTTLAHDSLAEVKAWVEGDVWGVVTEELVRFQKVYLKANGTPTGDTEMASEWAENGTTWGHYGREYAETAAREALASALATGSLT